MTTMKAIVQDTYGSAEVLRLLDVTRPTAGDGEVLIRVRAARAAFLVVECVLVVGGAMESVEDLVAIHGRALFRLAFLLTGQQQSAEDLYQEALLQIHRNWSRVIGAQSPHAYSKRVLVNTFTSTRRRRSTTEVVAESPYAGREPMDSGFESNLVERDRLWGLLSQLPPAERAALVLKYYEDLPDEQAAELLGRRASTIRANVARARTRLREQLAPEGQVSP